MTALYDNLTFDFLRDIVPIGGIIRNRLVVEVNLSFSVQTIPELIAYAKANPGKINMPSGGNGSPPSRRRHSTNDRREQSFSEL
jgi:tripartite-type tricarboxylate transporter receptor subunit TctC